MPTTVVIPTYNGAHLLEKHLGDVLSCMKDGDELIIVDDASTDTTVEYLHSVFPLTEATVTPEVSDIPKHYYPQVNRLSFSISFGKYQRGKKKIRIVVVVNPENFRFAATANIGVALATHQLILLINNDVSPAVDALRALEHHFEDDRVFAVGCLEYETHDGNTQSGKNKLWFEQGLFHHAKGDDFEFGHTAWASGGSAMFSRDKWLQLGGFDQLYYPAYWEDIDLSMRARKKGWLVLFDPQAVVYHHHETTNASVFGHKNMLQMSWKNADAFTWRHANLWQKLQHLFWKPYWLYQRGQALQKYDHE